MEQLKINQLAVWLNIVLLHILGFLWYGPLFGEPWMEMVGITMTDAETGSGAAGIWITNFIATVVPMYVLAWIFVKMNIDSALKGLGTGLLIAFSFVFLSDMTGDMFAQNPYGLSWITGGFTMVGFAIAGLILGAWKKYV
jgi:hypothetical protein